LIARDIDYMPTSDVWN